jgi:hypothetical protein
MLKKSRIFVLLGASLLFSTQVLKAQFTLSGEIRPRFEYRYGYKKIPADNSLAAILVSQRSRLKADYSNKTLATSISFQDVRIWGDESMKKDVAGIGLYEAWAEFRICDSLSVKAGRQEIIYDNERLLSINNWSQKSVTHDALLIRYRINGWKLDLGNAFNQSRDTLFSTDYNTAIGNYKTLNFIWFAKSWQHLGLQAVAVADGYQKAGTTNTLYVRLTSGLIGTFTYDPITLSLRGFYQNGNSESGIETDAWYAQAELSVKAGKSVQLAAGAELFSGKNASDTADRRIRHFTAAYGSNHRFNGHMDYYTRPADTRNAGLVNPYVLANISLSKKIRLLADFHGFFLQQPCYEAGIKLKPYLGSEADVSLRYTLSPELNVQAGFSSYLVSDSRKMLSGTLSSKIPVWGWVMLTAKPQFLNRN